MALSYRPPMPKTPGIKNKPLINKYRSRNPCCEVCLLEGFINKIIESHHILGNLERSDLLNNLISLCPRHHRDATYHIVGSKADKMKYICLAIKFLKKEVTQEKIDGLGFSDYVELAVATIELKFNEFSEGLMYE